jgi:hypothetical protein
MAEAELAKNLDVYVFDDVCYKVCVCVFFFSFFFVFFFLFISWLGSMPRSDY